MKDPRVVILQSLAEEMFARFGHDEMATSLGRSRRPAETRLGPKIYPNVDFYSDSYRKLGIPRDLFTPVFAIARGRLAGSLAGAAWGQSNLQTSQIYTGIASMDASTNAFQPPALKLRPSNLCTW